MNDLSEYLAVFWGVFLLFWVFILIVFPSVKFKIIEVASNPKILRLSSLIAIAIGLFHVFYHNIWDNSYRSIVSAFGWISLMKGVAITLVPDSLSTAKLIAKSNYFSMLMMFLFLLGLFLLESVFQFMVF